MWIISWRWNDKVEIEEYEIYDAAIRRLNYLHKYGKRPSLHEKNKRF